MLAGRLGIKISCIFEAMEGNVIVAEVIIEHDNVINRNIFDGRVQQGFSLQLLLEFVDEVPTVNEIFSPM